VHIVAHIHILPEYTMLSDARTGLHMRKMPDFRTLTDVYVGIDVGGFVGKVVHGMHRVLMREE